eukprot:gene17830-19613_t
MTAGMVSVPTIVPLKAPGSGRKWDIDTATPIELATATKDATIFYTVDGTKPEPFKKLGGSTTYRYGKPIYLGKGKITLKVMAVLNDGSKESSVNTKTFQIDEAKIRRKKEAVDNDEEDFSDDYDDEDLEELKMRYPEKSNKKQVTKSDYRQDNFDDSFVKSTKSAWQNGSKYRNDSRQSFYDYADSPYEDASLTRRGGNSRVMSKEEDSGIRKVLHGLDFDSLRIDEHNDKIHAERIEDRNRSSTNPAFPRTVPPRSSITAKYIQEETNFQKCVYCHAVRPADPFSRFCNECGGALPPVPGTRSIPPEEGRLGMCPFCHSEVPINAPSCVICDARFTGKADGLSSRLVEKVVCLNCGTSCPSGSKRCVVCENFLPVQKVFTQNVVNKPPQPNKDAFLRCSKCGRINSYDARFCDWCGSKPLPSSSVISCSTCRTSNQPYAKYCSACGQVITPPIHPEFASQYTNHSAIQSTTWSSGADAKWHSVKAPTHKGETKAYGTQTSSNYQSSKSIDAHCKDKGALSKTMRPLSAVSPGKGYWRQQMDHVCQHLKIYAQNNVEFRDSISQVRIGKLLGAIAQEELDGQELSIVVSFGLRNRDGHTLSASTKTVQHSMTFINALKNSKNAGKETQKGEATAKRRTKKRTKKKHVTTKEMKLSPETQKLLKMLSASSSSAGKLDADDLHEFIDAGASLNAVDSNGMTALKYAVANKQHNCVNVLIEAGVDVDLQSGERNNTALHEAVKLGMDGIDSVDKLLASGADADVKNNLGQTPYDLALKSGLEIIVSKFTAKQGQDLLK